MNLEKKIVKEKTIPLNVQEIWWYFSTGEGLKSFFAPEVNFEYKINGKFEMLFDLSKSRGLQGSEDCRILSFLPNKMLSFSWNNPPKFENIRDDKTWVVIEINPIDENNSKITLSHLGWEEDEEWNAAYQYFVKAWDVVLERLIYVVENGAMDWENPYYPEK